LPKQKEVRKDNYHLLREAGFNSFEADKYKDRSQSLVKTLCNIKSNNEVEVEKRILKILNRG